jgi:hypothetical protein
MLTMRIDFFLTPYEPLIPLPSQLVGAGSLPSDFEDRFADEGLRRPIAKDNAQDDHTLKALLKKVPNLDEVAKSVYELASKEARRITGEKLERDARFVEYLKVHDEQRKYSYGRSRRVWDEDNEMEMEGEQVDGGEAMELEEED